MPSRCHRGRDAGAEGADVCGPPSPEPGVLVVGEAGGGAAFRSPVRFSAAGLIFRPDDWGRWELQDTRQISVKGTICLRFPS